MVNLKLVNKYGLLGIIRLFIDFIFTKLYLPRATLIRRPFYFRNLGKLVGGHHLLAGPNMIMDILDKKAVLEIGSNLCANHAVHIAAMERIEIGDNVLMASRVYISDHSHGNYKAKGDYNSSPKIPPNLRPLKCEPVFIGDNCWLGEGVCVLPGSYIGAGSIIGAQAVVIGTIPENCIAVGIPAKVIKRWSAEKLEWVNV